MRTLHRNYIFEQLMVVNDGEGGPSDSDKALKDIANLLKKVQIKHRKNDEFLKWSYWYLINDELGGVKSYFPNNPLKRLEMFFDYQKYLANEKSDIPDRLDEWIEKCCDQGKEGAEEVHKLVLFNSDTYINKTFSRSSKYANVNDVDALEKLKKWHEISVQTFEDSQKIDIEAVLDFMENPQWPDSKNALTAKAKSSSIEEVVAKLPKPPQIDFDKATEEAALVDPDNYETVHNYANQIGIDVRDAVAVIAHFATVSCPTPYATLDVVQDMQELRQGIDISQLGDLVQEQDNGIFGRVFKRYRPTPYEQTPFYEVTELAQTLPQKAREDADRHGQHVKILQIGLDIIHGYDDSLRAYISALTERKAVTDEEKADTAHEAEKLAEAEELTTRAITDGILRDSIKDKLNDLNASRAFARAHAVNFATLLRQVMKSQGHGEAIAGLAANTLLPLQQMRRAFYAYQAAEFGKAIANNNDVIEGTAVETDNNLSQAGAQDIIEQSMKTLSLMLGQIHDDLSASRSEIIDIAQQTEEAAAMGKAQEVQGRSPA